MRAMSGAGAYPALEYEEGWPERFFLDVWILLELRLVTKSKCVAILEIRVQWFHFLDHG